MLTTHTAQSPDQARQAIEKIKRKGRWARTQALDAQTDNPTAEQAFNTAHHAILDYNGHSIHVKVPRLVGHVTMNVVRPVVERMGTGATTRILGARKSLEHEEATYELLREHGVPSIHARRDVREELGITGALLTDHVYLQDARPKLKANPLVRIELGIRLRQLHDAGAYWADANLKNVKQDSAGLVIIDFQHQYREDVKPDRRHAHDLVEAAVHTAVLTGTLDGAIDVLTGYHGQKGGLPESVGSLVSEERRVNRFYRRLRNKAIFGEDTGIIDESLRRIGLYAKEKEKNSPPTRI